MNADAHGTPPPSRLRQAFLLLISAGLLLFSNGHHTIAPAAWLAPIFLLRYTRTARGPYAWILAGLVIFLTGMFQLRGMVPLPFWGILAIGLGHTLLVLAPCSVDRLAGGRAPGYASTLIFPCAVASLDFGLSSLSPYGSWEVIGYSQYGDLPIMQLASITGMYGISFLVSWLGPVVNWAWEHECNWPFIRRGVLIFVSVVAGVHLSGGLRLAWSAPPAGYQRVAGIAADNVKIFPSRSAAKRFIAGQPLSDAELASVKSATAGRLDKLFAKSEQEVKAGAKLVFWSEGGAVVLRSDEPATIRQGSEFASRNHVYLGMAIGSFDSTQSKICQNKLVLIGPDGRVLFEYWKSRPVPGWEKSKTETNGNPMRYADTPLGRIGSFICFDLDFPSLVRQAGRAHVDLLIGPSNDWRAIDPWNTQMAAFRAIENGCNLVRDVSNGRSLAVDYLGRPIAETDYFTDASHVIVADMPTHGVQTLYAKVGDLFAWICLGGLVVLAFAKHDKPAP